MNWREEDPLYRPCTRDMRRIDRDAAMRILTTLHRFAETGTATSRSCRGTPANCASASETTAFAFTEEPPDTCSSIP